MSPAIAASLHVHGFDVVDQREVLAANASDTEVLAAAWPERRIVIARDYDMAELVLRGFAEAAGVVIVAFDFAGADAEADRLAAELINLGERTNGRVHVIEARGVRSRPFDSN